MTRSRRNERRAAGVFCVLAFSCILIAGLWPFGHPPNQVTFLAGKHTVHFGNRATILSIGPWPGRHTQLCSIEMLLKPTRSDASSTLLAFYEANGIQGFSLHQSLSDLRLDSTSVRGRAMYVSDVFRAAEVKFLTVVSGHEGTDVYLDGALARRFRTLTGCAGSFVVGDSPNNNNTWEGELSGLAIYGGELDSAMVRADYESWTKAGRPDGNPDALYLFDEERGNLIHDHGPAHVNLSIPNRYLIARQTLLEFPWNAFEPTWGYVEDVLINIGGFVPFGFTLSAFLMPARENRGRETVVLLGFLLSIAIETLQVFLPTRDSDLTDVMTNTLGTWFGMMLYQSWLPKWLRVFSWMRVGHVAHGLHG